jgi:hypothetical protein
MDAAINKGKQRASRPAASKESSRKSGTYADSSSDSSYSSRNSDSTRSSRRSDHSNDTSSASSSSSSSSDSAGSRRRAPKHKSASRSHLKITPLPDTAQSSLVALLSYVFVLAGTCITPGTISRNLPLYHIGSIFSQSQYCKHFWHPLASRFEALQNAWPRIIHFIVARIAWFNSLVDAGYSVRRLIRAWQGKGSATMHDVILIQSANLVHVPAPAPVAKSTPGGKDSAARSVSPQEGATATAPKAKANNNFYCTYCDRAGHSLDYCNAHKKAIAYVAANPAPALAPAAPKGKAERLP